MPDKKKGSSAKKALRQSRKRQLRNKAAKSRIKSSVTAARTAMTGSDTGPMIQAVKATARTLDKASSKGLIHRNTAARKKSRLMRRLASKVPTAAPPAAEPSEPTE